MVTPRGFTFSAPSGAVVRGGRRTPVSGKASLLALLRSTPDASWVKANSGRFDACWPAVDLRTLFNGSPSSPAAIIRAWSGFAWDDDACDLILWGGGHANSGSNAVYRWLGSTRKWQLAFHDTEIASNGLDSVDGAQSSPVSSHTYANNVWLPVSKRFATFGGAAQPGGDKFKVRNAAGAAQRSACMYVLDLTEAGTGKVAGAPGSNVKRGSTAGISLPGANAWQLRDWQGLAVSGGDYFNRSINGWACAVEEGGKDVVYVNTAGGPDSTSMHLVRVQINDINDPASDQITLIGRAWDNANQKPGAFAPDRQLAVVLRNDSYLFEGWRTDLSGTNNKNFKVPISAVSGDVALLQDAHASGLPDPGMLYDERRGVFVAWFGGGHVFDIVPPTSKANLETSGWTVTRRGTAANRPLTLGEYSVAGSQETGVTGKWRYSRSLGCYVALQECFAGDVWLFRPAGWTEPN